MTVAPTQGGGGTVSGMDDWSNVGMEDVEASDLVMPRIRIDHKNGVFVNGLSNESFSALTVIVLGVVKQRVMWPSKLEDDSKPRCKSPNNVYGFPNQRENQPKKNLFPWAASNFEPGHAQPIEIEAGTAKDFPNGWTSNNYPVLSCSSCLFSKWGKDEDGKRVPPPCSEQHTYVIKYAEEDENGDVNWINALFTVQRTAIPNSKAFINSFYQGGKPFFTRYTGLTLRQESRKGNEYSIPEFKLMQNTEQADWINYATEYRSVRDFLRAAPRQSDENADAPPADNTNAAPVEEPVVVQATVAPPAPPAAKKAPPVPPKAAPSVPKAAQAAPAEAPVSDLPF